MNNSIWRLNSAFLAGYTEDAEVMRKIRRSYPDFAEMATYEKNGVIFARQYRIPSVRKRSARHLFNVSLS
ncbi:hypothetical protein D3C73_1557070 [compost metagenome]